MIGYLRRCVAVCLCPIRNRRGQLAIPALFVIPSLFLFLYLIFETAKLSREKIRHQFAVDAAAFIEMTNYSDFLNRSAYVNGAFPQRIFEEGFYGTPIELKSNTEAQLPNGMGMAGDRLYEILYKNGAFPADPDRSASEPLDNEATWFLKFGGSGVGKNQVDPIMGSGGRLNLLTMQDALDYWISWDDAQDIYKLYVQIYQLLGSVEDAQYSVFCRLTGATGCPNSDGKHNFYRKSYWLNTNDNIDDAYDGAQGFNRPFRPHPHCIQEIMIHGNKPTNNAFQPYQIWAPNEAVQMPKTIEGCEPGDGLFQIESIDPNHLIAMKIAHGDSPWPGYPITQHWDLAQEVLSSNYFNVNFHDTVRCQDGGGPCVHATIAIGNPAKDHGLWPNPTPKFQTRLYP